MTATQDALTTLFREHAFVWNQHGMWCRGCRVPRVTPETEFDYGDEMRQFEDYEAYARHLAELVSPEQTAPPLPAPSGWRGSGMPDWTIRRTGTTDAAYVTPVPEYNRRGQFAATEVPTLDIEIPAGEWTYPDARNVALAVLAATYWRE